MMDLAREKRPGWSPRARELLPGPRKTAAGTLYGARYYPELHTLVCTVDLPEGLSSPGFYLVGSGGERVSGGYMTARVRYGVAKVIFEDLEFDAFDRMEAVGPFPKPGEVYAEYPLT